MLTSLFSHMFLSLALDAGINPFTKLGLTVTIARLTSDGPHRRGTREVLISHTPNFSAPISAALGVSGYAL
ncbi:hypothetical protein F5Y13DRAFT_166201 [Hypoxylon sp. FL1857]|nr:hypothetical protein F5Y13DRAFT_166201 [Hypoxylon sp. FL1857]